MDPANAAGTAFDTPSLLGLYAAVSYLHDGRATSLAEVFTTHNAEDRHGVTSHLSEDRVDDLVAFLRSLPAGAPNVTIREIDGPMDDGRRRRSATGNRIRPDPGTTSSRLRGRRQPAPLPPS